MAQDSEVSVPCKHTCPFLCLPLASYKQWGPRSSSLPAPAQDTVSDLQLIVAINAVLVFLLGAARALLYEIEPGRPQHLLWQSLYAVLVILFGQDFPDESADVVEQARRCACPLSRAAVCALCSCMLHVSLGGLASLGACRVRALSWGGECSWADQGIQDAAVSHVIAHFMQVMV